MAVTTIFMLLVLMVALDMLVTFKLYRTVQDECDEQLKHMKTVLDCMRHEIATYRLSIDGKIERAILELRPKRKRRKLKVEEKKEECKKKS